MKLFNKKKLDFLELYYYDTWMYTRIALFYVVVYYFLARYNVMVKKKGKMS